MNYTKIVAECTHTPRNIQLSILVKCGLRIRKEITLKLLNIITLCYKQNKIFIFIHKVYIYILDVSREKEREKDRIKMLN